MTRRRTAWTAGLAAAALIVGAVAAPAAFAARTAFDTDSDTPISDICEDTELQEHTGFQIGPACVDTEFGEVADAAHNPSLLITKAPDRVRQGQNFQIKFSSKNLIRDRFLPAAKGGYYVEGAVLDPDTGITHGHAHIACRNLSTENSAPDQAAVPAFFFAIEDGKGGTRADTVTVNVPGRTAGKDTFGRGVIQCAVWAGDGSHRTPMMQRANQTPAFDVVRIDVVGR